MSSLQTQYVSQSQNPIRGFLKESEEKFQSVHCRSNRGSGFHRQPLSPLLMSCCTVVPLPKIKNHIQELVCKLIEVTLEIMNAQFLDVQLL